MHGAAKRNSKSSRAIIILHLCITLSKQCALTTHCYEAALEPVSVFHERRTVPLGIQARARGWRAEGAWDAARCAKTGTSVALQ